jgi:hypothetical protein
VTTPKPGVLPHLENGTIPLDQGGFLIMSQEASLQTSSNVDVMCFSFLNPFSVNGPFGTFELWVDGENVRGRMTMTLLFGLPSNTYLNLTGTCTGTDPHVCTLDGTGYYLQFGHKPVKAELGMTITLDADWSAGELAFTQGVIGVTGGLPVKRQECKSSS